MPVTISGTTGIQTPGVANSGTSTAALFSGPLAGNVTGNASTATLATSASTAVVANSASNIVPASNLGLATCKAWVNFNGAEGNINNVLSNSGAITVTSGSTDGTWAVVGSSSIYIGQVYYIRSINGVANALLGGRNVSNNGLSTFNPNVGFRIISQTTNSYGIRLLEGPALTNDSASVHTVFVTGIRSAYNVSSVTRNGTGIYTVNFATAMADPYYCVMSKGNDDLNDSTFRSTNNLSQFNTTTSCRIAQKGVNSLNQQFEDSAYINVTIFGN